METTPRWDVFGIRRQRRQYSKVSDDYNVFCSSQQLCGNFLHALISRALLFLFSIWSFQSAVDEAHTQNVVFFLQSGNVPSACRNRICFQHNIFVA